MFHIAGTGDICKRESLWSDNTSRWAKVLPWSGKQRLCVPWSGTGGHRLCDETYPWGYFPRYGRGDWIPLAFSVYKAHFQTVKFFSWGHLQKYICMVPQCVRLRINSWWGCEFVILQTCKCASHVVSHIAWTTITVRCLVVNLQKVFWTCKLRDVDSDSHLITTQPWCLSKKQ